MKRTAEDFCWGALAARLLHPLQVEVIEALRWIDRPLTGADLLNVLDRERLGSGRMAYHLKRLRRLEAVEMVDKEKPRIPMEERTYLVGRPGA